MIRPDCEDDEDEYVAGDPERPPRDIRLRIGEHNAPGPTWWHALSVPERIAVVRWLQRGDARGILSVLSNNPSSDGLRYFVSEGLAGGPETGWRLRIASSARGGAPRKTDKAKLAALPAALAGDGGDVAEIAGRLAGIATGERSRRGRFNDPVRAALVGLSLAIAYGQFGVRVFIANSEDDLAIIRKRFESPKRALYEVARFYGDSEKNIERLNTAFWKAGRDAAPKQTNYPKRK